MRSARAARVDLLAGQKLDEKLSHNETTIGTLGFWLAAIRSAAGSLKYPQRHDNVSHILSNARPRERLFAVGGRHVFVGKKEEGHEGDMGKKAEEEEEGKLQRGRAPFTPLHEVKNRGERATN